MLESRNKLHTIKLWFSKGYNAVDWWSPNAIIMTQNVSFEQQNIMLQLGLTSWEPSIILPLRRPQFCTAWSAEMHISPDLQKGHPEVSKTLPGKESEYLVLTLESCAAWANCLVFLRFGFCPGGNMNADRKKYLTHGCHQAQTHQKGPSLTREAVATIQEGDDGE